MNNDWIKSIPGYLEYFKDDHRAIINLIGLDKYFILYEYFGKTGIYFPAGSPEKRSMVDINKTIELIGEDDYKKLCDNFKKTWIDFSGDPVRELKKAWVTINSHVDYYEAARMFGVSIKTIYNWRHQGCEAK